MRAGKKICGVRELPRVSLCVGHREVSIKISWFFCLLFWSSRKVRCSDRPSLKSDPQAFEAIRNISCFKERKLTVNLWHLLVMRFWCWQFAEEYLNKFRIMTLILLLGHPCTHWNLLISIVTWSRFALSWKQENGYSVCLLLSSLGHLKVKITI